MVSHVTSQTHAVVERLLTIALILETADSSRHVKIAYATRMGSLSAVVHGHTGSGVLVVLVVIVDADVAAHFRLRRQTRTLGTYVDHTVQCGRTVQHGRGTFDHLHLCYVLQRHVIPVDLTGLGVEDSHLVHQHLATRTDAVRPSSTTTDTRLFVDDLHTGQGL